MTFSTDSINESIWKKNSKPKRFRSLDGDKRCDILIIGGGITGILTAFMLEQSGVDYILVEKDRVCSKTTANMSAKITYQHGLCYHRIIKLASVEAARKYFHANKLAFDEYTRLCKAHKCDWEHKDNFVYTQNIKKAEDEIVALGKIGYKAQYSESLPIPIQSAGAVRFRDQAQFNPLKFLYSLSNGLNIYENTFVRSVIGNTAITENGKIRAENIIIATRFPFIDSQGMYFLKLYQHRSYFLAIENAQNVKGMYVDDDKKGMSFRNSGELLLIGGGGHRTGENGGGYKELREFARIHYPISNEVASWAAQDCISLDSMPYIGRYSKKTNRMYTASGFNKWGVTSSMAAAMILRDNILCNVNDYADVFSPSRSILKPQILINGFKAAKNYIHPTNKRCSHLGCSLERNCEENSWDCPCHGSRFSDDGSVIDNPAQKRIKI